MRRLVVFLLVCAAMAAGAESLIMAARLPATAQKKGAIRARVLLSEALAHYGKSEYDAAAAKIFVGLAFDPKLAGLYNVRANVAYSQDHFDAAIVDYDKAIALDAKNVTFIANRGNAYRAKKDYDAALRDFDAAIAIEPTIARSYHERALLRRITKEYDLAIADHTKAIDLANEFVKANYIEARAGSHWAKGDFEAAFKDLNKAIELEPKNAERYRARAEVHYWNFRGGWKNERALAIADYSKVIELLPKDIKAYYWRANAYETQDNLDAALADRTKLIELQPAEASNYSDRGRLLLKLGRLDRSLDDHTKALELEPGSAPSFVSRARVLVAMGKQDQALADLTTAVGLDPKDGYALMQRAILHLAMGDIALALADGEKTVEVASAENVGGARRALASIQLTVDDAVAAASTASLVVEKEKDKARYSMIVYYLARVRAGDVRADAEFAANATVVTDKSWPTPLIELFTGSGSEFAAREHAKIAEQNCEADYYIGVWHAVHRRDADAKQALQSALSACAVYDEPYTLARLELKRLTGR